MKRGGGSWKRNTDVNQGQSSSDTGNVVYPETLISYTTDIEPSSYVGWKLYFPEKSKFFYSII